MRNRLVEMRLWTLASQDYLARAEPALAELLALTFPRLNAEEIIACARLLLAEYITVTPPYCEKTGARYPSRKVEILSHLIEEFEQLE